jgi:hypothetical protein
MIPLFHRQPNVKFRLPDDRPLQLTNREIGWAKKQKTHAGEAAFRLLNAGRDWQDCQNGE